MKTTKRDASGILGSLLKNESKSTVVILGLLLLLFLSLCVWQWTKTVLITISPVHTSGVITAQEGTIKSNKYLYTYKVGEMLQLGEIHQVIPFLFSYHQDEKISVIYSGLNSFLSCPERSLPHEYALSLLGLGIFVAVSIALFISRRVAMANAIAEEKLDHKKQIQEFEKTRGRDLD